MAKTHITRKQLKEDEVLDAGRSFYQYILDHRHNILTAALGLMALVLLVTAFKAYGDRRLRSANSLKYEGMRLYEQAIMDVDAVTRKDKFTAALDTFKDLEKRHGSSAAAKNALYLQANTLLLLEDNDAAAEKFAQYMEKASVKQEKAKAAIGIGHAWENKAFDNQDDPALLNQALESYKKAEELGATSPDAKSHLAYEAMLGSARVLTQLGKLAEAKAVYEKVIAERPYHEEKMDEVSDEQWMQWPSLSREDKSRLVRKSLKDMQAVASFQSLAKSRLEKLEVLIRETEQKAQ